MVLSWIMLGQARSKGILLNLIFFQFIISAAAQQGATCSKFTPCKTGCCSSQGNCGFGDEFCGKGCQGTCNATAECGKYAAADSYDCPLNVCCSKWGYCGFTSDFCNSECQNKGAACPLCSRPQCSESTDAMSAGVRIGYYGVWDAGRSCDALEPEGIPAGVLTHINVAFEYVSADHEITDSRGPIVGRVSRLKNIYPGLRVNIALGGWSFNDPPTQTRFSDMVSTTPNREKFINSLIAYLQKYALNGVDIDWEYPVADDRGGQKADFDNYVLLCSEIRKAFDAHDPGWQLTITLPSSYWYLRGFSINRLQKYVDWFNVMTYDIHGLWDQHNAWTGPYIKGHTNLTEIEDGLDLLWRNGITPDKVVMGYGFYGRGFTMSDPNCATPPTCTFDGPSYPGDCTNQAGILSYSEVMGKEAELGAKTSYDDTSSVKWMVYGGNQWISFDDAQSFERKKKYMFSRCLKGLMIWELGLDTVQFGALSALFGDDAVANALSDTSLNPEEASQLAFDLAAYTGQNCYVTQYCTQGGSDNGPGKVCVAGFSSLAIGHNPIQMKTDWPQVPCPKGQYHHICCPTKAMPKDCKWVGAPERSEFGCNRGCGASEFELTSDTYVDQWGQGACFSGSRSLCCDAADILRKCSWTDCGWTNSSNGNCGSDQVSVGTRMDQDNGDLCKSQTGIGQGGSQGPTTHHWFRSYCCPKNDALQNCMWSDDPQRFGNVDTLTAHVCVTKQCPDGTLAVTGALMPQPLFDLEQKSADSCVAWVNYPGTKPEFPLCCSPPSRYTQAWPVNPAYLWSGAHANKGDDVTWQWADDFGNNDADTAPHNMETDPGADPYGFVMLDGPPGSIAKQFHQQFTVLTRENPIHVKPRSWITTKKTVLDSTFDHVEETVFVYCNFPHDSKECNEIFYKGARNTIIKLPHHVGEGPWARVVSMEPEYDAPPLPSWAIRKREASDNSNGIYRLTFDYDFHLIERDDNQDVFMRVDYTNLQDYWKDVTDTPASKKRSARSNMNFHEWKSRVQRAKKAADAAGDEGWLLSAEGRADFSPPDDAHPVPPPPPPDPPSFLTTRGDKSLLLHSRWFGAFLDWLSKITAITKQGSGSLPMGLSKVFNIYSGRLQCSNSAGVTINAGLDITATANMKMGARYAYYFSGSLAPTPKIIDTYVFLGAQPSIYAGIDIRGSAELIYQSDVRRLIETLTYPGLSIKGIATVGPSLDVWGRIEGKIIVSGEMQAGAKYTFGAIEMYLPNDQETHDRASSQLQDNSVDETGISPVFEGNVRAEVDFHMRITPEIDCGIKIGGGSIGPAKDPFVDAHIAAFMNTSLHFNAYVTASADLQTSNWEYGYKIELLWRIGLGAIAQIRLYGRWQTKTYYPVDWQTIPIYGPVVVSSAPSSGQKKRGIGGGVPEPWLLPEHPLPDPIFGGTGRLSAAAVEVGYGAIGDGSDQSSTGNMSTADLVSLGGLERRANGPSEFQWGDFRCTSGGSTPCDSNNLPISERRRDTTIPPVPAGGSLSRVVVAKRAPTDCRSKIPRLYYNCRGFFSDVTITGSNGQVTLPGLCTSVRTFLSNNGIITNRYPLSYDPNDAAKRRSQTCSGPRNPCGGASGEDQLRKSQLGQPWSSIKTLVNCDEFPFASAEEGGYGWAESVLGIYPSNPQGVTRTCIPEWQNSLQGNCNKLLNNIETNVEYFNNWDQANDDPNAASWQRWDSNSWNVKKSWTTGGDPGRQRLTEYPTDQNIDISGGMTATEKHDRRLSWMHKRNFTLLLVNNDLTGSQSFPGNEFSSGTLFAGDGGVPVTNAVGNAAWIICAVSTRGQDRFRFHRNVDTSLTHNGYCWDGQTQKSVWGGVGNYQALQYFSCDIDFVGAPHRKRTPIGYFGGEPVYGVKRSADSKVVNVNVPVEEMPLPDSRYAVPLSD